MAEAWFAIIGVMSVVFAILDGWTIGAGSLHLQVARTPAERQQVVEAIGHLWIWNETWLVGIGGVMLMAFPAETATAFSGWYLSIMVLLWCLVLRGIALEFGRHLENGLWREFWDVVFARSSVLLALLFGITAGMLVRGVPLEGRGSFTMPFFTTFSPLGHVGIIDWYTVSVGLTAVLLLMAHGACYLAQRTVGAVCERSRRLAGRYWAVSGVAVVVIAAMTWSIRPVIMDEAAQRPLLWCCSGLSIAGAVVLLRGYRGQRDAHLLLGSVLILIGLLGGVCTLLYPDILRSTLGEQASVRVTDHAEDRHGLMLALIWWPVSVIGVVGGVVVALRAYSHRARI